MPMDVGKDSAQSSDKSYRLRFTQVMDGWEVARVGRRSASARNS